MLQTQTSHIDKVQNVPGYNNKTTEKMSSNLGREITAAHQQHQNNQTNSTTQPFWTSFEPRMTKILEEVLNSEDDSRTWPTSTKNARDFRSF